MKQFALIIAGIFLIGLQGYAQEVQQVVLGSEEYQNLKAQLQLNSELYQVVNPENSQVAEHTTVYPAGHGTNNRDINCGCWVEPDATYTLLQNITGTFDDGFSSQLAMPFTFDIYDDSYNSFYININGNITFGNGVATFSPDGFPSTIAAMVAPFWGDVDLRCPDCGEIFYKITEDAVFVNWIDVAYYNQHTDKKNSFQLIITDGTNDFVGAGKNTSFCYEDMQWTTGDASGGSNGFGGSAATVGSNKGDGTSFVQFGRFSSAGTNYDGPFGNEDGVSWLDNQSFVFNSASESDNIQPIATNTGLCDTLQVCINEGAFVSVEFIAPEQGQTVTLTFDDGGLTGISDVVIEEGSTSTLSFVYTGLEENIGVFPITVTATDNGVPVGTTSITTFLEVINVIAPPLTITGGTAFCNGNSTTLTASEGFDSYQWNPDGCNTPSCEFFEEGTVTVTATIDVCTVTSPPIELVEEVYFIPAITIAQNPICSNDSTLVSTVEEYAEYTWNNYQDFPGSLYGALDEQTVYASAGTFILNVVSEEGCPGQRIFNIEASDANVPEDNFSGLYCDTDNVVDFCCGSTTSSGGNFNMSFFTAGGNAGPWATGASVDVYLNGELVFENIPTAEQVANSGGVIVIAVPGVVYGDYVELVYDNPANSQTTTGLAVTNCVPFPQIQVPLNPEGGVIFSNYTNCNYVAAEGEWTVISGPDGSSFTETDEFNTSFTAGDFGTYELNFFSTTCGIDYQYELIFGLSPEVSVLQDQFMICEGDVASLEAVVVDPLDDADFSWSTDETTAMIDVSETGIYCASAVNQCATVEACVDVQVLNAPEIDVDPDYLLCDGEVVSIDPIANDDATMVYDWTSTDGFSSDQAEESIGVPSTYTIAVTNFCGTDTENFDVATLPSPTADLPSTIEICGDEVVNLDPVDADDEDPSFTYVWTSIGGFSSIDPEVDVTNSDTYTVTVSNDCGNAIAAAVVEITPIPVVDLELAYSLCAGSDLVIDPVSSDDESFVYTWTSLGGFTGNGEEETLSDESTYVVLVENECGSDNGTFDVIAIPLPTAFLGSEAVLCDGELLTLDPVAAENEHPSFVYEWSSNGGFSANSAEVNVSETDVYQVVVMNDCGEATSSTSVEAFVSPITDLNPLNVICAGDEVTLSPVQNFNSTFITSWTGPNGFNSNNPSVTLDLPGDYVFTVDNTCLEEPIVLNTSVQFNVAPEFSLNFETTFLCPNAGSLLIADIEAGQNINWTWSVACGLLDSPDIIEGQFGSSLEIQSVDFSPECLETGALYILSGSNACGAALDTTFAFADPCLLTIPNIFSPDNDADEINEYFAIDGLAFYILRGGVNLQVFNRFGSKVYEDTDYKNDWKGSGLSDGVYFYILTLPDDGSTEYNGTIEIVRK